MKLMVNFTAVTPLMQTETTETRRKEGEEKAITTIKTRTIYDEEAGGLVKLPVYTGNGFRGLLRRKMSEILLEEAQRKEIKINTTDYFLMTAGGGANYQKQEFDIVQKVKSLNPVISLLGTSLAIPGKLIVTDFMPVDYRPYLYEFKSKNAEDNGEEFNVPMLHYGCSLIQIRTFTKKDDILNQTKFGRFLSKEDVKAWEETIEKERALRIDCIVFLSFLSSDFLFSLFSFSFFLSARSFSIVSSHAFTSSLDRNLPNLV